MNGIFLYRAEKILSRINELADFSDDAGCISRIFGTKAFIEGRNKVQQWMKEAGLKTRIDNIGNIRGRLLSERVNAKTLVIASHIDTVINAGKFDGPLGVLIGLDLMEQLIQSKAKLPFHIELIAFCDEEGCRFHTTYLGSKSIAGTFDKNVLQKKDNTGVSLQEVIQQTGGDVRRLNEDTIAKKDWLGYYELHIEQGPVLYKKNIPVGIVTSIAGQRRAEIIFKGEAGHAGTVPMDMRKDALSAAAEFTLKVEEYAISKKKNLVATVGRLSILHSASNVIPGQVICSLDIRSAAAKVLSSSYNAIKKKCESICSKRNIAFEWNLIQETKAVACDEKMNQVLALSVEEAGYKMIQLISGAGHDAVAVSEVSPVVMLFVRCFKGISHNPLEDVELKDIASAIKVSDNFIERLTGTVSQNP
jgi:allantoate deiminase